MSSGHGSPAIGLGVPSQTCLPHELDFWELLLLQIARIPHKIVILASGRDELILRLGFEPLSLEPTITLLQYLNN